MISPLHRPIVHSEKRSSSSLSIRMSDFHTADLELLTVAKKGDLSRVQALVAQWRAKLSPSELTASHLRQPLVDSLMANQAHVSSYLLDQGAELDSHIVNLAPIEGNSTDMFQVFLDHGWDINNITSNGAPRLKYAKLPYIGTAIFSPGLTRFPETLFPSSPSFGSSSPTARTQTPAVRVVSISWMSQPLVPHRKSSTYCFSMVQSSRIATLYMPRQAQ